MIWLEILSELFVNLSAAWFAVVFVEPQLGLIDRFSDVLWLILKAISGILSLFVAKHLR